MCLLSLEYNHHKGKKVFISFTDVSQAPKMRLVIVQQNLLNDIFIIWRLIFYV